MKQDGASILRRLLLRNMKGYATNKMDLQPANAQSIRSSPKVYYIEDLPLYTQ